MLPHPSVLYHLCQLPDFTLSQSPSRHTCTYILKTPFLIFGFFQLVLISPVQSLVFCKNCYLRPTFGLLPFLMIYRKSLLLVLWMWILCFPASEHSHPSSACHLLWNLNQRQAVFQYHLPAIQWKYPESRSTQHVNDSCCSVHIPCIASYSRWTDPEINIKTNIHCT